MEDLNKYLVQSVQYFASNPPNSDFQRGYLAALQEVAKEFGITVPNVISKEHFCGVSGIKLYV